MNDADQFVGEDSSDGSETEVVIQSGDESNHKEQDYEKSEQDDYQQPEVDNQPEVDKPQTDDAQPTHNYVDEGTTLAVFNNSDTHSQPNEELSRYEGFCDGTRCQRPYTWYTTRHVNTDETETSPKVDVNNVVKSLKETIDLTRTGRDVKKRKTRKKLRRHPKNQPRHTKQKQRTSRKPSLKIRKLKTKKTQKPSKARRSPKTSKAGRSPKILKSQNKGKKKNT